MIGTIRVCCLFPRTPIISITFQKKGGDENELALPEGWVAIPGATIVREKHQKKYNTRDEIDERLETEERHRLGDVTNEVSATIISLLRS